MIFRPTTNTDLDALLVVQQQGAVAGLSHIFPQDKHPFQPDVIKERWRQELVDPSIRALVSTDDEGAITGFAAIRDNELLHFGTAVEHWGSGFSTRLHDFVVGELLVNKQAEFFWLRVFEENLRGRRFYEKLSWQCVGTRTQTSFAPHPYLVEYRISRDAAIETLASRTKF